MKHIDGLSIQNKELFQTDYSNFASIESTKIIFLILFGCTGLFFYARTFTSKHNNSPFSNITRSIVFETNEEKMPKDSSLKGNLKFNWPTEVDKNLTFVIENYVEEEYMKIDFGDGNTQYITGKEFNHINKKPGIYDVNLNIDGSDKSKNNKSEKVYVYTSGKDKYYEN